MLYVVVMEAFRLEELRIEAECPMIRSFFLQIVGPIGTFRTLALVDRSFHSHIARLLPVVPISSSAGTDEFLEWVQLRRERDIPLSELSLEVCKRATRDSDDNEKLKKFVNKVEQDGYVLEDDCAF
ncbi:hypothetical protein C8Q79DRAFT_255818 [Trametes meyenii]|nr:hypothetical protein C8Q79DRAFT_255818 [Trametes meyenii]